MYSVGQAAEIVGKPHQWVRYQIGTRKLGRKVGWAIILSEGDMGVLINLTTGGENNNGNESQQAA